MEKQKEFEMSDLVYFKDLVKSIGEEKAREVFIKKGIDEKILNENYDTIALSWNKLYEGTILDIPQTVDVDKILDYVFKRMEKLNK